MASLRSEVRTSSVKGACVNVAVPCFPGTFHVHFHMDGCARSTRLRSRGPPVHCALARWPMRVPLRSLLWLSPLVLASVASAQVPAGGEFLVNTGTTATQTFPVVAVDPTGAFMVSWFDAGPPLTVVEGRRFDRRGTPQGVEFQVNTSTTTDNARDPVVAADDKGRFAVVWGNAQPGTGTPAGVFARVFNRQGVPLGAEFRVSVGLNALTPNVSVLPGGFVAAWGGYSGEVFARRFDVMGNLRGPQPMVNSYTTGVQYQADVAGRPDGGFVVVWTNGYQSPPGIFAQRFNASDAPVGAQFKINSSTTGGPRRPRVAGDGAGNFVVVWQEPAGGLPSIVGRRFDAAGAPQGAEFVAHTFAQGFVYYHSVKADRAGAFAVVWEARGVDGDGSGILARRFTRDGAPRGPAFIVNTYTTQFQVLPEIATDGVGNLTAVWMSPQLTQVDYEVYGQRYGGLIPTVLDVDVLGNRVLEVGDTF